MQLTAPTKNWRFSGQMKLCASYQVQWWLTVFVPKSPTSCRCKTLPVKSIIDLSSSTLTLEKFIRTDNHLTINDNDMADIVEGIKLNWRTCWFDGFRI
jgi:hypothetical protein